MVKPPGREAAHILLEEPRGMGTFDVGSRYQRTGENTAN
jgi:hypothetical protein